MSGIIDSIKNIVIVIVASEFIKNFLISDKYKKYVGISVNILILAFLIAHIKGTELDFDLSFSDIPSVPYSNTIYDEYKENIELELKKEFERENIFVKDIIIDVDEKYNVTSLKIFLMDNNDYNSVKNITDKTGIENYEIIRQN